MAGQWLADNAFASFKEHLQSLKIDAASNEATTRLRAIDTVLFDVLKWDKGEVEAEKYCRAEGYADYAFGRQSIFGLVLEAKRAGDAFVLPKRSYPAEPVPFCLIAQECPNAADALRQAAGYAVQLGARVFD